MRVLFVCTGNTCRSPLAAAIAAQLGMDASSAGLAAMPGQPATPQAVEAARKRGLDLTAHRSRRVDAGTLDVDLIVAMTASHRDTLQRRFAPKAEVVTLGVEDPFGGDQAVYDRCAEQIEGALRGLETRKR